MKIKICALLCGSFLTYKLQAAEAMPSTKVIQVIQDDHTFINKATQDVTLGTALVKRLVELPEEKYSDHELMLISSKYYSALSYNIGELFELKSGSHSGNTWHFINNGFMIEHESSEDFSKRTERIIKRTATTSALHNTKVICLQEASKTDFLYDLLSKNLPDFNIYQEGPNIILVDKSFESNMLSLEASKKRKIMAVYIKDFNLVVVNIHAAWAKKSAEESKKASSNSMLADFNKALDEIAQLYENTDIEIYGDYNREDYELPDEYRTVDIREFAKNLNIKNTQVFTSKTYTNIRYVSPHLDKNYSEDLAGVLTTSDYFIQATTQKK